MEMNQDHIARLVAAHSELVAVYESMQAREALKPGDVVEAPEPAPEPAPEKPKRGRRTRKKVDAEKAAEPPAPEKAAEPPAPPANVPPPPPAAPDTGKTVDPERARLSRVMLDAGARFGLGWVRQLREYFKVEDVHTASIEQVQAMLAHLDGVLSSGDEQAS